MSIGHAFSYKVITIGLILLIISCTQQNSRQIKDPPNCGFEKYLNNPNVSQLAKNIYLNKNWNLNNDKEALSILDSLTAKDKDSRAFYFKVSTLTYRKSDGYFSEALGLAGYEYVKNNPSEFAGYFDNKECFKEKDLETWTDIIMLEFQIMEEKEYSQPIADNFFNELKRNCRDCSSSKKETIEKFSRLLKQKWSTFLKNID